MPTFLCNTSDFDTKTTKGFCVNDTKIFVVREAKQYYAYLNSCPHQHIALDWGNEQFLDHDEELIQCSTHGALFVIETGVCVSGPCSGASLEKLTIEIVDDEIYLHD